MTDKAVGINIGSGFKVYFSFTVEDVTMFILFSLLNIITLVIFYQPDKKNIFNKSFRSEDYY